MSIRLLEINVRPSLSTRCNACGRPLNWCNHITIVCSWPPMCQPHLAPTHNPAIFIFRVARESYGHLLSFRMSIKLPTLVVRIGVRYLTVMIDYVAFSLYQREEHLLNCQALLLRERCQCAYISVQLLFLHCQLEIEKRRRVGLLFFLILIVRIPVT